MDKDSVSSVICNGIIIPSYLGDIIDRFPFLVTAIPYNGMYSNFDEINP